MKTDGQLKMDVTYELQSDPAINATNVGVAVEARGHVDGSPGCRTGEIALELAVQRLQARAGGRGARRKGGIEDRMEAAPSTDASGAGGHRWPPRPRRSCPIKVEQGWVTLSGELDCEFQRDSAYKAVRTLTGVVGVTDLITLKPCVAPADISSRIRDALTRHAEREAKHIEVNVVGSTVTLRGHVDSWAERKTAQGAAWAAPGITSVVNRLAVVPSEHRQQGARMRS